MNAAMAESFCYPPKHWQHKGAQGMQHWQLKGAQESADSMKAATVQWSETPGGLPLN